MNFLHVYLKIKITKCFTEYDSNGIIVDIHWLVLFTSMCGIFYIRLNLIKHFFLIGGGCTDTAFELTGNCFYLDLKKNNETF